MVETEAAGLRQRRSRQAVELAMQGRWQEAVAINQSLVESFPGDVSAYNRLGRANMEIGDFSHAWEAYSRAIELDPYNTIARKNLNRLSRLREAIIGSPDDSHVEPLHFIEETGKAGVVNLYHLGPPEVVAEMVAGDKVYLKIAGSSLVVENGRGEYLGQVEFKHAQRLIKLMAGGNEYTAAVVSSTEDTVSLVIREAYQDPSQVGRLSFPAKGFKSPRPYLSDRVIKHEPELEEYEEEVGEEEPDYTVVSIEGKGLSTEESININDSAVIHEE